MENTTKALNLETAKLLNNTVRALSELIKELSIRSDKLEKTVTSTAQYYEKLSSINHGVLKKHLTHSNPQNYLKNIIEYMKQVNSMIAKLEDTEKRTQLIEDLAVYFKQERGNLKTWDGVVSKSIAEVDYTLQESVSLLKESIGSEIKELTRFTINQREHLEQHVNEQNKLLEQKSSELTVLTEELKELSGVKEGIVNLQKISQEQNRKFDIMADAIYKLMYEDTKKANWQLRNHIPTWAKALIIIIAIGIMGIFSIQIFNFYHQNKTKNNIESYQEYSPLSIPLEGSNLLLF